VYPNQLLRRMEDLHSVVVRPSFAPSTPFRFLEARLTGFVSWEPPHRRYWLADDIRRPAHSRSVLVTKFQNGVRLQIAIGVPNDRTSTLNLDAAVVSYLEVSACVSEKVAMWCLVALCISNRHCCFTIWPQQFLQNRRVNQRRACRVWSILKEVNGAIGEEEIRP
jgi:hypothetical protein